MTNLADTRIEHGASDAAVLAPRRELEPRRRTLAVVSVDDHLLEPPDMFAGRIPGRLGDQAPHVERDGAGVDWWVTDGERTPLLWADASRWAPRGTSGEPRPGRPPSATFEAARLYSPGPAGSVPGEER